MSSLLLASLAVGALVLIPLVTLRANAGIMFLAACAGIVLLQSIDPVVVTTASVFVPSGGEAIVRLGVVVLSFIFAAFIFSNSYHSSGKLIMHGVIGILMSVSLVLILPELTGLSILNAAIQEDIWRDVNGFRSLIIALTFALSLVIILTTKSHGKKPKH